MQEIDCTKLKNRDDKKCKLFNGFGKESDSSIATYPESFGYIGITKFISPDRFLKEAQKGHKSKEIDKLSPEQYRKRNEVIESTNYQKKKLKRGKGEVLIPDLEYKHDGRIMHEGRHRSWASKDLGIKKIPVNIVCGKKDNPIKIGLCGV